ncbi:hypothetical protein A3F06_00885 [candidate division TM6 bacterium RIFCSPHIGHO2_12_FULL_36_22]|nr:MAG: hypothetical protein A3F06_00885 [candidate division TM6 bacterium RIFCSPHIGHO2_12_FULL_36_22]
MRKSSYLSITLLVVSSVVSRAPEHSRVPDLCGKFNRSIGQAIEEMKSQKISTLTEGDGPITDNETGERLYSRLLLIGLPGLGKSITAEKAAKAAGATTIIESASSIVSQYVGSGAQAIKQLKEKALKKSQEEGKHVVIVLNEVDQLVCNNMENQDGVTRKAYESAAMELNTLLTDFEQDPRISVWMTANVIEGASPAYMSRMRDREIRFELPDAQDRQEFILDRCKKANINFLNLFANYIANSPALHKAHQEGKLDQALNFMKQKGFFGKTFISAKEYQEQSKMLWQAVNGYVKLKDNTNYKDYDEDDLEYRKASKIIEKTVLAQLIEQLKKTNALQGADEKSKEQLEEYFNDSAIRCLVGVTQQFSYRDLKELFQSFARAGHTNPIELMYIHNKINSKILEVQREEQKKKEGKERDEEIKNTDLTYKKAQLEQFEGFRKRNQWGPVNFCRGSWNRTIGGLVLRWVGIDLRI